MDISQIVNRVKAVPRAILFPGAVLAFVVVAAIGRLIFSGGPAPASAPRSVAAPTTAASATALTQPAQPAQQSAPVSSAVVAADMTAPPLPSVPAPAGLVEGRAAYTIETAPRIPLMSNQKELVWTVVGGSVIEARSVFFETLPVKALADLLPSGGFARETWSFWVQAPQTGEYSTVLKAGGYWGSGALVEVDGRRADALAVDLQNDVRTAVSTFRLEQGWHQVTVQFVQGLSEYRDRLHGSAEVFWRGPDDQAPVSIMPFSVDPKAQPAPSTSVAPAASAGTGGAK